MQLKKHVAVGYFQRMVNAMRAADEALRLAHPLTWVPLGIAADLKDDQKWGKFTDAAFWKVIIYGNRNGFRGCEDASGSRASESGPASVESCLASIDMAPAPYYGMDVVEIPELQVAWEEYHAILSGQCLPGSRTCIQPRRPSGDKARGLRPVYKAPDLLAAIASALFVGGTAVAGFVDW